MRSRILAAGAALALLAVACSNSSSGKQAALTTPTGSSSKTSVTEVTGAALKKNIPLPGVPGVTSTEIQVAVITAGTNPLAGDYTTFADGIQAYFNKVNSEGGIYGRKLVISAKHDDGFINDQQVVKASLAQDHAFATFVATPLFYGAPNLAATNPPMPTFTWNINQEFAGKPNFFGNLGALCFTCHGQINPYIARAAGLKRVAVLAYSAPAASTQCAAGVKGGFDQYPSAKVVYFDDKLQLGQADLSAQVSQMVQKNVQLVFTCIDQREVLILAKEMAKQHLNAVQALPNLYDPQFVSANAQYLEGDYVAPQFAALEIKPLIPIEQDFVTWMGKMNKPLAEVPGYGWIDAIQLVHGLKLAGPNFSQAKVINALNQDTAFSAYGMIVPIDWTRQHNDPTGPNGTSKAQFDGKWQCMSMTKIHDGKFVPVFLKPGKQFTCMTGGSNAPTLTKTPTYESFVPSAG
jgi:ABC-type branched-subunit amino acid transport system substrate-binding protein